MTIHRLKELVKEDLEAVDRLITEKIQAHTGLIDSLVSYLIQSGGKRLRPLIVLLTSHACNYSGPHHVTLAAMVEFFHSATLLHDDVVDESKMRRGRQTANEIWGDKICILVGDYLLCQYMQLMSSMKNMEIIQFLSDITYKISCGEIKQLESRHKDTLSETAYFEIISSKTSLLFAASACLGGIISESDKAIQKGLYDFGFYLGNAFQLIDDAFDYCADEEMMGKNLGDDLANGNLTLPLLHALKYASIPQQEEIKQTIKLGKRDNLPQILVAIQETNAIAYTKQKAANEVDKAISALQILPDSVYKTALIETAQYALERDH